MVSIVVQPASQVQVNSILWPPVVALQAAGVDDSDDDGAGSGSGTSYFATAVLLDHSGEQLENALGGTVVVSGVELERAIVGFAFVDLSVPHEGYFAVKVSVYQLRYDDPGGAVLVGQTESETMALFDCAVGTEQPTEDEHTVLEKFRERGVHIP